MMTLLRESLSRVGRVVVVASAWGVADLDGAALAVPAGADADIDADADPDVADADDEAVVAGTADDSPSPSPPAADAADTCEAAIVGGKTTSREKRGKKRE